MHTTHITFRYLRNVLFVIQPSSSIQCSCGMAYGVAGLWLPAFYLWQPATKRNQDKNHQPIVQRTKTHTPPAEKSNLHVHACVHKHTKTNTYAIKIIRNRFLRQSDKLTVFSLRICNISFLCFIPFFAGRYLDALHMYVHILMRSVQQKCNVFFPISLCVHYSLWL